MVNLRDQGEVVLTQADSETYDVDDDGSDADVRHPVVLGLQIRHPYISLNGTNQESQMCVRRDLLKRNHNVSN